MPLNVMFPGMDIRSSSASFPLCNMAQTCSTSTFRPELFRVSTSGTNPTSLIRWVTPVGKAEDREPGFGTLARGRGSPTGKEAFARFSPPRPCPNKFGIGPDLTERGCAEAFLTAGGDAKASTCSFKRILSGKAMATYDKADLNELSSSTCSRFKRNIKRAYWQ